MITIGVFHEKESAEAMADTLEGIANKIRAGHTSGSDSSGSWNLDGEDEPKEKMSTEAQMDDDS